MNEILLTTRKFIQHHFQNGSRVEWGSLQELHPVATVKKLEDLADEIKIDVKKKLAELIVDIQLEIKSEMERTGKAQFGKKGCIDRIKDIMEKL